MQLDPSSARPPPEPNHAEPLFQSLEDRLLFGQAQGILAGLTDCGHVNAARSLRRTAAELDLDVPALAKRFLGCLGESSAEPAKTLLFRIAELALLPGGPARNPGTSAQDVPPGDELAGGRRAAPAGALSVVPFAGGLSVQGVLDATTVPLLQTRLRPMSVASSLRSNDGQGLQLDLTGLTHLDGAGLRALDALGIRARDGGWTLRVTTPLSAELRRLLDFAVAMHWLPAAYEVASSASMRPRGGRTGPRPPRWTPAPSRSACIAELEALYDCYASACWSLAHRLLEDDGEAESVVQTAFLDVWEQLTSGTPPVGQAGARLLLRTHREALRRLREERTGPRPSTPAADGNAPPAQLDRRHALRLPLAPPRAGLSTLPGQQARALRLAFWGGLTVQEIAATTGVPLADVRADLLAGVRTLSQAGRPATEQERA